MHHKFHKSQKDENEVKEQKKKKKAWKQKLIALAIMYYIPGEFKTDLV